MPRLNKDLGKSILKFFLENFDREGHEPNKTFVPYAKRKYQVNHKLLNDTGKLRRGFRIERDKNNQIIISNNVPYAQYINEGTSDMEARPILYESDEVTQMAEQMIVDAIMSALKF